MRKFGLIFAVMATLSLAFQSGAVASDRTPEEARAKLLSIAGNTKVAVQLMIKVFGELPKSSNPRSVQHIYTNLDYGIWYEFYAARDSFTEPSVTVRNTIKRSLIGANAVEFRARFNDAKPVILYLAAPDQIGMLANERIVFEKTGIDWHALVGPFGTWYNHGCRSAGDITTPDEWTQKCTESKEPFTKAFGKELTNNGMVFAGMLMRVAIGPGGSAHAAEIQKAVLEIINTKRSS